MIVFITIVAASALLLALQIVFRRWIACHWYGFCPKCNSEAPARYTCSVCHGYTEVPPKQLRREWWNTYLSES